MFPTFHFNTLVHVWIVNFVGTEWRGSCCSRLSILLEKLPGCVRGSSSEGPQFWAAVSCNPAWSMARSAMSQHAHLPTGKGGIVKRGAFYSLNINIRSKKFALLDTVTWLSVLWMSLACVLYSGLLYIDNCFKVYNYAFLNHWTITSWVFQGTNKPSLIKSDQILLL